jgi:hypothetical protein
VVGSQFSARQGRRSRLLMISCLMSAVGTKPAPAECR